MKYFHAFVIITFVVITKTHGQKNIDSTVVKKIKLLDSIARINPNESLKNLEDFYASNKKALEDSPLGLEQVYYAFAKYHYYIYKYDKSISYSRKGKKLIKDNNLDTPTYYYDNMMGSIYGNQKITDSAALYFTRSADAVAKEGKFGYAAQINYNIASLYTNDFNLKDGFIYFRKSLAFYDKIPDSSKGPDFSFMMGNMAYVYEKGDSLARAKTLAKKAVEYGEKFKEKNGLIFGNLTLSDIFKDTNRMDSAYFYSNRAYKLARQYSFEDFYPTTAMHLAKFKAPNNNSEAIRLMEEISISREDRALNWLGNVDKFSAELYTKAEDYKKANFHLNKYARYQDSINKNETELKAANILEKYKASQKDLTIAQQKAKITEKENQNKIIAIIVAALAMLLIALFLIFRQRQKTQKQKIRVLENEKENVALRSLMAGEEKERSRIAKELHDGLGGILAVSKMHASTLKKNEVNAEGLEKLTKLLDTASQESRRISHNLLPENLITKGLDTALKEFVNSINESNLLDTTYQSVNLSESLPQSFQLSVYRIIQELLNNIIKHSEASQALIQLQQDAHKLTLTVEDNGKGFSNQKASEGIGLTNIKSRLSLLKGKLEIDSNETSGTSVYIELQLEK
ncbi:sensor histidine kinase [Rasiella rasia]|uniref:histidine kinase n=1 Tax=Rasiella rasia TaxID=2744027 RepID=A0A6G6GNZ2_9FLAO|nr:sensor histidine kinase [Rasiella rasia]QIE60214.1 sensor histidine kinase [Rasiella rasia]